MSRRTEVRVSKGEVHTSDHNDKTFVKNNRIVLRVKNKSTEIMSRAATCKIKQRRKEDKNLYIFKCHTSNLYLSLATLSTLFASNNHSNPDINMQILINYWVP